MRSLISVIALLTTSFAVAALPAHASAKVDPNTMVACSDTWVEPFKWSVLKGPRDAEKEKTSSASALRKVIRDKSLPRSGWFEISTGELMNASLVQYANGPIARLTTVTLVRKHGSETWDYFDSRRGLRCDPSVVTSVGALASPWYPVPDKLPTDPTGRSVQIAINIQGCGVGAENVHVDAISYSSTEVRIRVGVSPAFIPGIACPAIVRPPTEYEVALPRPIGKRAIVDIARIAPRIRASAKQLAAVRAGANPLEVLLFHKSNARFCKDSSGPDVYTVQPTKDQARRWKARDAKYCRKAKK